MIRRFFHTRIPVFICLFAFCVSSLGMVFVVAQAQKNAEATPEIVHELIFWGGAGILTMLAFCICLAIVTRYRRELSEESLVVGRNPSRQPKARGQAVR